MALELRIARAGGLIAAAFLASLAGCTGRGADPAGPAGVPLDPGPMARLHERTAAVVDGAPAAGMQGPGLAGVRGGACMKLLRGGSVEVQLPIPQLTAGQVPLRFAVVASPAQPVVEYRLVRRNGSDAALWVRLSGGKGRVVTIDWSAVVLLGGMGGDADRELPGPYHRGTPCVQSGAGPVQALAERLFPADGRIEAYAAAIQGHIRGMVQRGPPRSMDAVGILESGANWVCTANANLAAALLRARGIQARSLAVVPTVSQRLEMHRIVEWHDGHGWHRFDPSSLSPEIPLSPWRSVVMARTMIADEEGAMEPRMGTSPGCPYGQELEMLSPGATLWGEDFFWTLAKPLADFEADGEAFGLAAVEWRRFLRSGDLSSRLFAAAETGDAPAFLQALRAP